MITRNLSGRQFCLSKDQKKEHGYFWAFNKIESRMGKGVIREEIGDVEKDNLSTLQIFIEYLLCSIHYCEY